MSDTRIRPVQATVLLKEDHRKAKALFQEYAKVEAEDVASRTEVFERLRKELMDHARLEEEIFYPALAEAVLEDDEQGELLEEAKEAHEEIKLLLEEMADLRPGEESFEARLIALRDTVERHAEDEERDLFPAFKDLEDEVQEEVAERLRDRKNELAAE